MAVDIASAPANKRSESAIVRLRLIGVGDVRLPAWGHAALIEPAGEDHQLFADVDAARQVTREAGDEEGGRIPEVRGLPSHERISLPARKLAGCRLTLLGLHDPLEEYAANQV